MVNHKEIDIYFSQTGKNTARTPRDKIALRSRAVKLIELIFPSLAAVLLELTAYPGHRMSVRVLDGIGIGLAAEEVAGVGVRTSHVASHCLAAYCYGIGAHIVVVMVFIVVSTLERNGQCVAGRVCRTGNEHSSFIVGCA